MSSVTSAPRRRLWTIALEIATLRLDGTKTLGDVFPDVRTLIGADLLGIYSVR